LQLLDHTLRWFGNVLSRRSHRRFLNSWSSSNAVLMQSYVAIFFVAPGSSILMRRRLSPRPKPSAEVSHSSSFFVPSLVMSSQSSSTRFLKSRGTSQNSSSYSAGVPTAFTPRSSLIDATCSSLRRRWLDPCSYTCDEANPLQA